MTERDPKLLKIETSPMDISVTEEDFQTIPLQSRETQFASSGLMDIISRKKKQEEIPVDERVENIRKLLPSVIAKKIVERIPEGFDVTQLTISGEISGQPFGIGVKGQVSVVFEKSK